VKIAILVGSTRPGRKGTAVGHWVHDAARQRDDAEFELVELADHDLALLDEPVDAGAAGRAYERESTRAWSRLIDGFDGFVWVTPEYNHGVPAAMKNAVDLLYPEWNQKVAGFVGYGIDGATRAVEQWRGILAAVVMYTVRPQVALRTASDWTDGELVPAERHTRQLQRVLDQVVRTTGALRGLRD
jgi:NAD(P)H-dependent FMN reductase